MNHYPQLPRRQFLRSSASLALGLWATRYSSNLVAHAAEDETLMAQLRANLLQRVNEEREVEKVQPVVIDELATEVATKHAKEMANHNYVSHWNREGLKPYHRYSFAGGFHATQENVSAADIRGQIVDSRHVIPSPTALQRKAPVRQPSQDDTCPLPDARRFWHCRRSPSTTSSGVVRR